jgi:hypothetical protein
MVSETTSVPLGIVLQIIGYIIVAVGLYWAIKLDLQYTRLKAESAKDRANEAHDLADDAHSKLYSHIINEHSDRSRDITNLRS